MYNPAHPISPWDQVFAFVRAVLFHIIPFELWGSGRGKRALLSKLHAFIRMGKADAVHLGDVRGCARCGFLLRRRTRHAVLHACLPPPPLPTHMHLLAPVSCDGVGFGPCPHQHL